MTRKDLVILALSGVQRFITESRSTADLRSGSEIVAELAELAATCMEDPEDFQAELVFPQMGSSSAREDGMPNRIVALAEEGRGARLAARAAERIERYWRERVHGVFGQRTEPDPGWPSVQWVCAPPVEGGYAAQWDAAQRALTARKQVRGFAGARWTGQGPCVLSPRWPVAEKEPSKPTPYEREALSVTNWVKRRWHRLKGVPGFPPTNAVASSGYRAQALLRWEDEKVADAVGRLHAAAREVVLDRLPAENPVPGLPEAPADRAARWLRDSGGIWVYPETWKPESLHRKYREPLRDGTPPRTEPPSAEFTAAVREGRAAAGDLAAALGKHGVPAPATHLAVLVQDLDSMGEYLSGRECDRQGTKIQVTREEHVACSQRLRSLAARQRGLIEAPDVRGVVVYAGGDDLLALVPAATALHAARLVHDAVPSDLPSASTGVLFFHHADALQGALRRAREALEQAKSMPDKHSLAVGFVRGSGATGGPCVRPWSPPARAAGAADSSSGADDFSLFLPSERNASFHLSPGLVQDLERSREELNALGRARPRLVEAELRRLVGRHLHADEGAASRERYGQALDQMTDGLLRMRGSEADLIPAEAARVAAFLRQEAR